MPTAHQSLFPQQFETDKDAVFAFMRSQSAHHKQTIASMGLRGRTNGLLLKALGGKDIRVDYLRYLFGIDSSRDLTNAMCFAVEWLLTTGSEAEKLEMCAANGDDGDFVGISSGHGIYTGNDDNVSGAAVDNITNSVDNCSDSVDKNDSGQNEATRRGGVSMILARAKHSPQPPLDKSDLRARDNVIDIPTGTPALIFKTISRPKASSTAPIPDDLVDPFAPSHEETINRQPFSPKALAWLGSFKNSLDSEQGSLWSE
mgnify:FL=1